MFCKCFYIEVVTKKLRIHPDGVWNNSATYNKHDINDQVAINEHSDELHKHFKLKASQGN